MNVTYELGAELPMPIGEELEQLQRQSDAGTYSVADAKLYAVDCILPSGYLDNSKRYLVLYWEDAQRGCVITNADADWHNASSAAGVLYNWIDDIGN